jgi:subtilisin family serine protease
VSGVAKGATIVPVKVFDCGGSAFTSDVIAGLNWIIGDHLPGEPAVVNMSLGSATAFEPLDAAVNAVIADGITAVAAAGNSSIPSCNVSPARVPDAITVAATNSDDSRASYSNVGSCNDLFAPGTAIVSAGITGDTVLATRSGTSMAAPHVAGAVARYLEAQPGAPPTQVRAAIDAATDPGVTGRAPGDPDRLLFLEPPPPPCTPPPAGIIGWWKGDGSLAAVVGPPLTGTATYAPSQVGNGFAFDGTSSLSASPVPALTSALTVEAWVRPVSDTLVQTVAARWDFPSTDDAARAFAVTLQPGNRLVLETDETSTRRPEVLTAIVPQLHDGRAHHIAATWDRSRIALFVDGSEVGSKTSQGGALNPAPTTPLTIGGQTRGFGANGLVDEPTIYSRALGAAEIATIHAAGRSGKCP